MEELLSKLSRDPDSHKGENGRVGIIGGSVDYTGAPALAGKAALRTGCDLAEILTSEKSREVVASFSENLIVDSYPSGYLRRGGADDAIELAERSDSVVIGPGLGEPDGRAVKKVLSDIKVPTVVDADAIEPALEAELSDAVLTPHRGEAEVIEERCGSIQAFAKERNAVVVVKGPTDMIHTPSYVFENETGTSAMTVGGTGDTLAGVIASLMSQGLEPVEAARLGTWINGKAGELAAEKYGNGMVATDMLENIPEVMWQ